MREETDYGSEAYRKWIKSQAIWNDSDLIKVAIIVAILAGSIGFLFGFAAGTPDLSSIQYTGIRG